MEKVFPTVLMVLDFFAAIPYAFKGDKAIFGKLYFNGGFLPPFFVPQAIVRSFC